jgi:hypothetical protein
LVYFCDSVANVQFVKDCIKKGVNITVICTNEAKISDVRFSLLGIATVYKKKIDNSLDNLDLCATMFRSSRLIYGKNKLYGSVYHYKRDIQSDLMHNKVPSNIDDDFKEFLEFSYIYKLPSYNESK